MVPSKKMNNGHKMPQIGLGTWLNTDETECKDAVKWSLEIGYRHIDTAQAYDNEQFVGEAIKESGVKREDIFITTKISTDNMSWRLGETFEESLKKLKTDYVDLLLLHFPVTEKRRPCWPRMEDIYKAGKAKSIGVSNYTIRHLEELLREGEIKPAVNQVELHLFLQQPELLEFCNKHDIVVTAYSPLARARRLEEPTIKKIAKKHGKTYAQIMIRWCVEVGAIPIPKSTHQDRIKENFDVFNFKLEADDIAELKKLDRNFRVSWDPTHVT